MKQGSIIFIVLIIIAGIVLLIRFTGPQPNEGEPLPEEELPVVTEPTGDDPGPFVYQISTALDDVTGGTATGFAQAGYRVIGGEGRYQLEMTGENLPEPEGDDFYEGWIVRRGINNSVISTGVLEREAEGVYSNSYSHELDYTDHDFYVLTIEPNDGDPAPADHVLEGVMQ